MNALQRFGLTMTYPCGDHLGLGSLSLGYLLAVVANVNVNYQQFVGYKLFI